MTIDNLANWAFAYVLVGAVIWALLFTSGIMDKDFEESRVRALIASVGVVFGWPVFACGFVAGFCRELTRRRRVRP